MKKTKEARGKLSVKMICYCAAMTALCVVANAFTVNFGVSGTSNALSFVYTVCFLSGALLGPVPGLIVGLCGDTLGWLIHPVPPFNIGITVSTGLMGLLSGLVFFVAKKVGRENSLVPLTVISYMLMLLICSNLNTLFTYLVYMTGKYSSFWAYYIVRMPKQIVFWALNMVLGIFLIKPTKKIVKIQ